MIKKIAVLAFLAVCASNVFAFEASMLKPYIGVKAGLAGMNSSISFENAAADYDLNSSQPVFLFGVSIGTKLNSFRGEFDYTYYATDNLDFPVKGENFGGDHQNQTYLFNFYYDFLSENVISPYFGAGLGWTRTDVFFGDNYENVKESSIFTYAVSAGITYDLNRYIDLDLGYRYVKISDKDLDVPNASAKFIQNASQLFVTARYKF